MSIVTRDEVIPEVISEHFEVRFICWDASANYQLGAERTYQHVIQREDTAYRIFYKIEEHHFEPEDHGLKMWFLNTYGPHIELRKPLGVWKITSTAEQVCGATCKEG
jgi:hypothetical protein